MLIVDFNVNIHNKIAALGPVVKYGDHSNPETLLHTGVDKGKVVVSTIPDDVLKGTTNRKIVEAVRHINPDAIIIAHAIELAESKKLYEAGCDYVFLQRIEAARTIELAIEKALSGEISDHRAEVETLYGKWDTRREIM
jgi:voltage-gated potassium channel Kch